MISLSASSDQPADGSGRRAEPGDTDTTTARPDTEASDRDPVDPGTTADPAAGGVGYDDSPGAGGTGGQPAGRGPGGANRGGGNAAGGKGSGGTGAGGKGRGGNAPGGKGPGGKGPGGNAPGGKGPGGKGPGGKGPGGKGKGGGKGRGKGRQRLSMLAGMGPAEEQPEIPDQSHLPAPQRTDLAVRVNDLHITYRTSFERKPTMKQALQRFGRGYKSVHVVEALQGLSFEVKTGSAVGIIGANGAGKSTLLRAMSGTLPPTRGTVEVWGRTSTLLALGVGFNNQLSGRENIILGGLASGLSKSAVQDRAEEVAEWTELGDFIDMPMRTYSSGMFSRVAFSVAVHMEPDILMIDEALSTGDAHFRDKASEKMAELRSKARALFLVSHGLNAIRQLCTEAIWIDKGTMMRRGPTAEVIEEYVEFMNVKRNRDTYDDV